VQCHARRLGDCHAVRPWQAHAFPLTSTLTPQHGHNTTCSSRPTDTCSVGTSTRCPLSRPQGCMGFLDTLVIALLPCNSVDRGQQWTTALGSLTTVASAAGPTSPRDSVKLRNVGADGMCVDQHVLDNGNAQVRSMHQSWNPFFCHFWGFVFVYCSRRHRAFARCGRDVFDSGTLHTLLLWWWLVCIACRHARPAHIARAQTSTHSRFALTCVHPPPTSPHAARSVAVRPVETDAGVVHRQVTDACGADDRSGMDGCIWSRCRRATSGPAVLSERDDGTLCTCAFASGVSLWWWWWWWWLCFCCCWLISWWSYCGWWWWL
jgi:hypothetical protein